MVAMGMPKRLTTFKARSHPPTGLMGHNRFRFNGRGRPLLLGRGTINEPRYEESGKFGGGFTYMTQSHERGGEIRIATGNREKDRFSKEVEYLLRRDKGGKVGGTLPRGHWGIHNHILGRPGE